MAPLPELTSSKETRGRFETLCSQREGDKFDLHRVRGPSPWRSLPCVVRIGPPVFGA